MRDVREPLERTMSAGQAFTRTWSVGPYSCTMTCPLPIVGALVPTMEWVPECPQRLTPDEIQQYRDGRNAAFADLARETGVRVGVLEV
jgi:hypothetical protein